VDPDLVQRREGLSDEGSFMNSGVMCLDPKFWASHHMLERALDIARDYGWEFFNHADQGILNILSHRHARFTELPRTFNYLVWPDIASSRFSCLQRNDSGYLAPMILSRPRQRLLELGIPGPWKRGPLAKVLHWNGPMKPWDDQNSIDEKYRCFLNVYGQF
jgi:lipopolysaccharide biosynthesis glycosyltransferase